MASSFFASAHPPGQPLPTDSDDDLVATEDSIIDELRNEPNFKQGKVAELRQELTAGGKKDKNHSAKKIALKKIVANMTMSNNDMVALFPDIVQCMHIPSLEIKKMYVPTARLRSLQFVY